MSDDSQRTPHINRRQALAATAAATSSLILGHSDARAGDPEITLKLATVAPPGTPWAKHISRLKKRVKEGTDGRVRIKAYLGGALGTERKTLERVKKGGLALHYGSVSAYSELIPELGALQLPYLFPDAESADDIIDEHLRPLVEKELHEVGLELLFFSELGHRSIGTSFGFIKSTADLQGKKMRAAPGSVHLETWQALGASPKTIADRGETMTALQTGSVAGFDHAPLVVFAASWFQAITHFTLTRHSYEPALAVVNKETWDGLPAKVRELIRGDVLEESKHGREKTRAIKQQLIDNFDAAKVAVHTPTSAEKAAFQKVTKPTHKKFTDKYSSVLYKAITKHI